jgi:hypothetical protein
MDRDTTSTPYKASEDGLVYFRYPNGDAPVVTVADYAELRTKGLGDAGFLDRITVSGAYITGAFEWQADDPYGNGDDGGLVIAATDGWWVRKFAYNKNSPIELDWWQPTDQTVWTPILQGIADVWSDKFIIRTPATVASGFLDKVTVAAKEIYILGQNTNFNFIQTAASVPGAGNHVSLALSEFEHLELDYNVEFSGSGIYRNVLGENTGDRSALQQWIITLNVRQALSCIINCSVTKPIADGIYLTGPSERASALRMIIGGTFTDCGLATFDTNLVGEMHYLDTCRFVEASGGTLGTNPETPTDPTTSAPRYTRYRMTAANGARKHTGVITAVGGYQLFNTTTGCADGIGSAEEPLKIICIDGGTSLEYGLQTPVSPFFNNGIGKFDGLNNGDNHVYVDYIFRGSCLIRQPFAFEASPDSPGEVKYCKNFHMRVFDETDLGFTKDSFYRIISNDIFDDNSGLTPDSFIQDNIISGNIPGVNLGDGPQTLQDVTVSGDQYGYAQVMLNTLPYLRNDIGRQNPLATINNMTILESAVASSHPNAGPICIYGVTSVVMTNLVCSATNMGARNLITIGFDGNETMSYLPLEPCVINLITPQLSSGMKVAFGAGVAQNIRDQFTFQIDGVTQTLPWTAP